MRLPPLCFAEGDDTNAAGRPLLGVTEWGCVSFSVAHCAFSGEFRCPVLPPFSAIRAQLSPAKAGVI
ncbi:hypothetical protein DZC30_17750 [Comamonas testosteroni]|uniref:Uncharacterized protein n=1 Tax=Comamonas testosteroni TaxID=285 RepID=A0A373FCV6_COMTE|nr:hypothetical protein DZC30_17750 [Comamonas testosteroni]